MPSAVYLSPHLDDAVFSCGGLIARQVEEVQSVTVITVFAGDPPQGELTDFAGELQRRWGRGEHPMESRRNEDLQACALLGAAAVHIALPEAIYRKGPQGGPLYVSEEAIFGPIDRSEKALIAELAATLEEVSPAGSHVYAPLAVGGHVDHRLVRRAAQRLERPIWFYHDMPYAARGQGAPGVLGDAGGLETVLPLADSEIEAWIQAAASYRSQLSSFWDDEQEMQAEIEAYVDRYHGLLIVAPERRAWAG